MSPKNKPVGKAGTRTRKPKALMAGAGKIRSAVVGYGGAFNMGRNHLNQMLAIEDYEPVAVCDLDSTRLEAACVDCPGIKTYASLRAMLKESGTDLVVIVTPHNTHAQLAIECLRAGKHVVVEKPMCITVKEATAMITAAEQHNAMLSIFHNRRQDGDFMALKEALSGGLIGQVFHLEAFGGGYGHPGYWWRGNKAISGGAFYDWGAHFVDWILNLLPGKMVSIDGYFHKLKWTDVSNEDHVEAVIRFDTGAVANVQLSHLALAGKPRWRILGTEGAIVDSGGGRFTAYKTVDGYPAELEIKYRERRQDYYANVADHLLRGAELEVKAREGRRVIAVLETAELSSKAGKTLKAPFE